MDVIYPRCAGLDVHKQTVVACARLSGDGAPSQEVRTFAPSATNLRAMPSPKPEPAPVTMAILSLSLMRCPL